MRSKDFVTIALAGSAISPVLASTQKPRPRGVGPEFAKYYKASDTFSCILNPHIIIPSSAVNDDFCDCPDGSDEPGTAACSQLLLRSSPAASDSKSNHSLALPGFYCKNKGHKPAYAPFTVVNDGVCDYNICCDGSDEWAGIGGIKCEDRCATVGAKAKKLAETKARSLNAALRKRAELIHQAERERKDLETKIATWGAELAADAQKINEAEKAFQEAQEQDKLRVRKESTRGGKLEKLRDLTKVRIAELKVNLGTMKQQKYDAEYRVRELEGILATFKEEYNPNFNDEGVKRASKAWEEYESRGRLSPDWESENKAQELVGDDSAYGIDWDDYHNIESEPTGGLYDFSSYLPPSVRIWLNSQFDLLQSFLVTNGILPESATTGSSSEGKAVIDARNHLDSLVRERDSRQNEITNAETDIKKDYGPHDIFRALKDTCEEVSSGEYTYEHCFTQRTTQKPTRGGSDTNMGYFTTIEFIDVEPPAPGEEDSEEEGLNDGSGRKIVLKYENGQHCWNGPARSTSVVLTCAEESKIWRVVEEEKCIYRMDMGSPAACLGEGYVATQQKEKDEL